MTSKKVLEKLSSVKLAMAQKYENLAKTANSQAKRKRFLYHAAKYYRQSQELAAKAREANK